MKAAAVELEGENEMKVASLSGMAPNICDAVIHLWHGELLSALS